MEPDPDVVGSVQSHYNQNVPDIVASAADRGWEVWFRIQWVLFINKNHSGYQAFNEQEIYSDNPRKSLDVQINHDGNVALIELKCLKPVETNKEFSDRLFDDVNKLANGQDDGFIGVPSTARTWTLGMAVVANGQEQAFADDMSNLLAIGQDFRGGTFQADAEQFGQDHYMFAFYWTRP
jgi:hypothetical protein